MAVKWTFDQQNVINARGSNLLVSAAAGSGKTAVLVERIIERISGDEDPIDIDRLLVVTFTRAAAAEMRERVTAAIEERCIKEPQNERLLRQQALVHNAQITTIDSFCAFVVRNHFGDIGIEPNFRVADQSELDLLRQDVVKDVFEECYKEADSAEAGEEPQLFIRLIDAYSGSRSDAAVKDMVISICKMSESSPWPKEWVAGIARSYQAGSAEEFGQTDFMQELLEFCYLLLTEAEDSIDALLRRAQSVDGLDNYAKTLENDLRLLDELLGKLGLHKDPGMSDSTTENDYSYDGFREGLKTFKMGNMARVTGFEGDESTRKYILDERNRIKKDIESLKSSYFKLSLDELYAQTQAIRPMAEELTELSLRCLDAFDEAKRQRRIVSFSDMEHYALNILVDENTKKLRPAAEEFKDRFDEIMIDEYQDSNQVQEEILTAVSRESRGEHNMFMVGDIKQSIYRYRLARPEIFMEKYRSFDVSEDAPGRRITLSRNFRSRIEVIDFVNDIFTKIMHPDLGNVAYDKEAMLYKGADYPKSKGMEAEVLLYDSSSGEQEDEPALRMEFHMIAQRIRQLYGSLMVKDASGGLRPLKYGDIAILMRGVRSSESDLSEILSDAGIPVHIESTTGYFSSQEVRVMLAFLQILDNPLQDIPLAAVLHSPIAALSDEQLAQMRIAADEQAAKDADEQLMPKKPKACSFSEAAWEFLKNAPQGSPYARFYELYTKMRSLVQDTPIHELIQRILEETGYRDYVCMLPAGHKRAANLDMLVEKAADYEQASYKGLFHFVRYIEKLHQYDVDFGEARDKNEQQDAVSVMTIHKSKGLEFPVVFVAGIGRKLNQQDSRKKMLLHSDLGIGLYEMQLQPKRKTDCLIRLGIADRITRENLGEELRILYVAMTRAKEKLILTGTVKNYYKAVANCRPNASEGKPLAFSERFGAGCYLDWILPAMRSYPEKYKAEVFYKSDITKEQDRSGREDANLIKDDNVSIITDNYDELEVNADEAERIRRELAYVYPYSHEAGRKSKYSVSELKHDSMLERYDRKQNEAEVPYFLKEEKEPYVPMFVRRKEESAKSDKKYGISQGALRGTAVHRVMECLDFHRVYEAGKASGDNGMGGRITAEAAHELARQEILRMQAEGLLSDEYAGLVPVPMIAAFLQDPIALRMAYADARGELFCEKPFVMEKDGVLIQGIVDAFWMEGERIVLLDYKTDAVKAGEELLARYKTQLMLYAEVLMRLFGKDGMGMECMMYSFRLKEIVVC